MWRSASPAGTLLTCSQADMHPGVPAVIRLVRFIALSFVMFALGNIVISSVSQATYAGAVCLGPHSIESDPDIKTALLS